MTFLRETPFLFFLWGAHCKKKKKKNPSWWLLAVEDEPQWQIAVDNIYDKDEIAQSRD